MIALFCLPTDQSDEFDFDDDISTYVTFEVHAPKNNEDDINDELFTVQSFVSAHEKDKYCFQLAEKVGAPSRQNFFDEFVIPS